MRYLISFIFLVAVFNLTASLPALAQSNVTTDSSVKTDTTTDAGVKGSDSVRTTTERTTKKSDVDDVKPTATPTKAPPMDNSQE